MYDTRKFIQFSLIQFISLVQTDALDVTCCIRLHTLLLAVGSCCAKFETGQIFRYVEMDSTTSNNVASVCTWLQSLRVTQSCNHLFRSPQVTIPNFCHFWLNSVTEYQPRSLMISIRVRKQRLRRGQREHQKAVGLDLQNNNFACALCSFVYFFAVTARPRRKSA